MFINQTAQAFTDTARPKVLGTSHLDELSRELCPELEYFVVYSSIACQGNFGQSSYAMANSAIERICELRKADKLPALAIEFGPVGNVGAFVRTLKQLRDDRTVAKDCLAGFEQLERKMESPTSSGE